MFQSMCTSPPSNIHLTEGRVFIDISQRGCGSGCLYCYIDGTGEAQELLPQQVVSSSVAYLIQHPNFVPGLHGTLLSLCPNTEPFKTNASTDLITLVLRKILPLGNPVQIPTKERVPASILQTIRQYRTHPRQVILFISSSTVSKATLIEPGAAAPEIRFQNIHACRQADVPSCLYIKPFTKVTFQDINLYIDTIRVYDPPVICVGVLYRKGQSAASHPVHLYHPARTNLRAPGVSDLMQNFRDTLANIFSIPIFYSSVCVSAYIRDWYPVPNIWRKFPDLCINCRNCEAEYQRSCKAESS